jgi:hypothetical protein
MFFSFSPFSSFITRTVTSQFTLPVFDSLSKLYKKEAKYYSSSVVERRSILENVPDIINDLKADGQANYKLG